MSEPIDSIDSIATKAFEGYVVRKDLVRRFKGQYPVPTYVAEFLLGRYCASTDDDEIAEGLKIVERQLSEKTVRAGEHELFKARAKDKGTVKLIDLITARLDAATDSFVSTLPSLQLKDVRIAAQMVHEKWLKDHPVDGPPNPPKLKRVASGSEGGGGGKPTRRGLRRL